MAEREVQMNTLDTWEFNAVDIQPPKENLKDVDAKIANGDSISVEASKTREIKEKAKGTEFVTIVAEANEKEEKAESNKKKEENKDNNQREI